MGGPNEIGRNPRRPGEVVVSDPKATFWRAVEQDTVSASSGFLRSYYTLLLNPFVFLIVDVRGDRCSVVCLEGDLRGQISWQDVSALEDRRGE